VRQLGDGRLRFPSAIRRLAIRGDGRYLAVSSGSAGINLWNLEDATVQSLSLETGLLAFSLRAPNFLSFEPREGDASLYAAFDDGVVRWDFPYDQPPRFLFGRDAGEKDTVHHLTDALAISPDGKWLAHLRSELRLYSLEEGLPTMLRVLPLPPLPSGEEGHARTIVFSPDSSKLAAADFEYLAVLELEGNALAASKHARNLGDLAYSTDGESLRLGKACFDANSLARIKRPKGKQCDREPALFSLEPYTVQAASGRRVTPLEGKVLEVEGLELGSRQLFKAVSWFGTHGVVSVTEPEEKDASKELTLWDLNTGKGVSSLDLPSELGVLKGVYGRAATGELLLHTGKGLWRLRQGEETQPLPLEGYIHALAIDADASRVAVLRSTQSPVELLSVDTNTVTTLALEGWHAKLCLSGDGGLVFVSDWKRGELLALDTSTGAQVDKLSSPLVKDARLASNGDGSLVVAASEQDLLLWWRGKQERLARIKTERVFEASVAADGSSFALQTGTGIQVWSSEALTQRGYLPLLEYPGMKLAGFDPSGRYLLLLHGDGSALVLDVEALSDEALAEASVETFGDTSEDQCPAPGMLPSGARIACAAQSEHQEGSGPCTLTWSDDDGACRPSCVDEEGENLLEGWLAVDVAERCAAIPEAQR
jgi:WD40 repeat protein